MSDSLSALVASQRMQSLCFAALLTAGAAHCPIRVADYHSQRSSCVVPIVAGSYTGSATIVQEPLNLAQQLTRLVAPNDDDRDVTLMSHICGVSRKTFYGWLNGEPIKAENQERLRQTITVLASASTRHPNLFTFLTTETPIVGKPSDLLHRARHDIALGLSFGIQPASALRTSPSGRALKSIPFVMASQEATRRARRTRDIADVGLDAIAAYANEIGTGPIGYAIVVE